MLHALLLPTVALAVIVYATSRTSGGVAANVASLHAAVLDPLGQALGRPLRKNSGVRSATKNQAVGGVKNSRHLTGLAADVRDAELSATELVALALDLGLPFDTAIVYETGHLHLDHNPAGRNRQRLYYKPEGSPLEPMNDPR